MVVSSVVSRISLFVTPMGPLQNGSDQMAEADDLDAVMQAFQQAVSAAGIRRIEGSVVGDASWFSGPPAPDSWLEQDAGNYYGAGAWALMAKSKSRSSQ